MSIYLTHYQIKALLDFSQTSDCTNSFEDLQIQHYEDGHSGPGLYAWNVDYPENGAAFFPKDERHAIKGREIFEMKMAAGEIKIN